MRSVRRAGSDCGHSVSAMIAFAAALSGVILFLVSDGNVAIDADLISGFDVGLVDVFDRLGPLTNIVLLGVVLNRLLLSVPLPAITDASAGMLATDPPPGFSGMERFAAALRRAPPR